MRSGLYPIRAATVCGVAGFGVLAIASTALPIPDNTPTMWHYWSGTVGDAILLPCIVGLLTLGATRLDEFARNGLTTIQIAVVVAGLAIGSSAQLAWITDPAPRTNWMVVAPHQFSVPGFYHLVFVAATSGYIAYTLSEIFFTCSYCTLTTHFEQL